MCFLQSPAPRTPGGARPPQRHLQGCNKENEAQLKGTPVIGALLTRASPQRHFSIASVASTYSEFVVIHTFLSLSFFFFNPATLSSIQQAHTNDVNLSHRGTWSALNQFSQGVFARLRLTLVCPLTNTLPQSSL